MPSSLCITPLGGGSMKCIRYGNYDIYEDGRIYSHFREKFLKPETTVHGYKQVTLFLDRKILRIRVHQLVALLFVQNPNNLPVVNHKDGNKNNNHYTNLEWSTYKWNNEHARITGLNNVSASNKKRWENKEFRKQTSRNISQGLKRCGKAAGEKNPRFRYRITCDGIVITRIELAKKLGLSQSRTDALIFNAAHQIDVQIFSDNNVMVVDTKREGQSTIESYKSIRADLFSGVENKAG